MGKTVPDQIPGQSFCCLYDASETTFRWAGIDRIIQPNRPHDEAASYYSMTGHRAVNSWASCGQFLGIVRSFLSFLYYLCPKQ